jgi:hypothetical protein
MHVGICNMHVEMQHLFLMRWGWRQPRGVRGAASATATEGAGPGAGRDAPHETRLDSCEFCAKSKTGRRFVAFNLSLCHLGLGWLLAKI